MIVDNYATHKRPKVQRWLSRHKRFHMRFTPANASWLNMTERFFRDLTCNSVRRGVFRSVAEPIASIDGTSPSTINSPNRWSGRPKLRTK